MYTMAVVAISNATNPTTPLAIAPFALAERDDDEAVVVNVNYSLADKGFYGEGFKP
jgi:hypothetical protein